MKKVLAILTAAILLFGSASALAEVVKFAEDSSNFDIQMELPEGASVGKQVDSELVSVCQINSEGLASVYITIAPSDIYGDLSMEQIPFVNRRAPGIIAAYTALSFQNTDAGIPWRWQFVDALRLFQLMGVIRLYGCFKGLIGKKAQAATVRPENLQPSQFGQTTVFLRVHIGYELLFHGPLPQSQPRKRTVRIRFLLQISVQAKLMIKAW